MPNHATRWAVAGLVALCAGCGTSSTPESTAPPVDTPTEPPDTVACAPYAGTPTTALRYFEGTMHEHTSYSDGDILSVPADVFAQAKERGNSFVGASDHSDTLDAGVFISVGSDCFTTPDGLLTCLTPAGTDSLAKWSATAEQIAAASDDDFLAIRGFEWTSDRFGHINVYFSQNFSNAKTDGGYFATLETFWSWLSRAPDAVGAGGSATAPVPFGGGADGLAHFNHPTDKCLADDDPGCDWYQFELVPAVVEQMFGMELYNGGGRRDRYVDSFHTALDRGWRLSPIGSEDEHGTDWGGDGLAKTVTLATDLSEAAFREAWSARRTYAQVAGTHLEIAFQAADHPMGSELQCEPGTAVPVTASVRHTNGGPFAGTLQLVTSAGEVIAESATEQLSTTVTSGDTRRWYYLRVNNPDGESLAFAAPVWIEPPTTP